MTSESNIDMHAASAEVAYFEKYHARLPAQGGIALYLPCDDHSKIEAGKKRGFADRRAGGVTAAGLTGSAAGAAAAAVLLSSSSMSLASTTGRAPSGTLDGAALTTSRQASAPVARPAFFSS